MTPALQDALAPAYFVNSDHAEIVESANAIADGISDHAQIAERFFYAVRDGFRYDPYNVEVERSAYRASDIIHQSSTWCVPKSIVLTAYARALGIPARLGFSDVRNHLTSEKLSQQMGTDVFAWHGYSELWLNDRWVKLSTAFNKDLCDKFGVMPLEFDAIKGALMHPFDQSGRRHMEYVLDRGIYLDLPLAEMFISFADVYPGWEVTANGDVVGYPGSNTGDDATFD